MPDITKDVMVAVLGAAVGLAGLLLIFSGFLFAQAASFPRDSTPDTTIDRYSNAGRWGLAPFLMALAVAALSFAWLIDPCIYLYRATVIGFVLLIATSACYGSFMLIKYL
jgi:hypothetical protein